MFWLNMLQDSVSPIMEQLIMFHDHTMMIISMITIMVSYMMINIIMNKYMNRFLLENQMIELLWTIMPSFMLIFIALPSLKILYMMEEMNNPLITIKSIGHQWYWSYQYSDFYKMELDSYMKSSTNMETSTFRLLDVDNRIALPFLTQTRIIVSSTDVIHSWTIPSLGVKLDALPGRMNQSKIFLTRPGIYYGQCSEICGSNHSFMPITLESVNMNLFIKWLKNI
uniref:Cytochrome c oxidase subunit 2 n=1 Tax=Processina sexmaculata TaxID=2906307 RepID=A0A977TM42_9HEMI|nr:cytochrome c oxidase subunit II [Processina sexmaculata]UXX17581.1 cytochrome c oxidase subunit II [Processina sexmaculata]